MSRDLTRRDLLRGGFARDVGSPGQARDEAQGASRSVEPRRPQGELPRVIAWLDDAQPPRVVARRGTIPLHRPPGALAEEQFLSRCTRCGRCSDACAPKAIQPAPPRFREAAGTPWIDAAHAPCRMCDDTPCISACDPGALLLDGAGRMGSARVLELDCLNRLGTTCTTCVEHCPVPGALGLAGSMPFVDERACTGCGVCLHVCPAPSKAIVLMPERDRQRRGGQ